MCHIWHVMCGGAQRDGDRYQFAPTDCHRSSVYHQFNDRACGWFILSCVKSLHLYIFISHPLDIHIAFLYITAGICFNLSLWSFRQSSITLMALSCHSWCMMLEKIWIFFRLMILVQLKHLNKTLKVVSEEFLNTAADILCAECILTTFHTHIFSDFTTCSLNGAEPWNVKDI